MSRPRTPVLLAGLTALALALSACGTDDTAATGTPDTGAPATGAPATDEPGEASETAAPAVDQSPASSEWITAEQMAAATVEEGTIWLTAAFLPAGAEGEVDPSELEIRHSAWTPPEGQMDYEPAAEAFRLMKGATPEGLRNALAGLDLILFSFPGMDQQGESTITVDFGEGIAATRSMSSAEGLAAFSQFKGILMANYPRVDMAKVTVEGQPEPELFGGIDTTRPFPIR